MKRFIIVILALISLDLRAQLLAEKDFYPGVNTIKTRSYSGTGGGGYWSLATLDSLGRTTIKEKYRKRKLLSKVQYKYNSFNDVIEEITIFDINSPNRADSNHFVYNYNSSGQITYQNWKFSDNDSIVYLLIGSDGDSAFKYKKTSYHHRQGKTKHAQSAVLVSLTYNSNDLLAVAKEQDTEEGDTKTTYFEYYPNGKLKRRRIERVPAPEFKPVYTGGPGSDDMSFKYEYDKAGRPVSLTTIIDGKEFLLSKYKYR